MLHVDLPPDAGGGVASQVARLSDTLVSRGHDVVVRTLSRLPSGASYRVETIRFPAAARANKAGVLLGIPVAFAAGRYGAADVVHAHGDSQFLFRRRIPVVRTFYGSAKDEAQHAERRLRQLSQRLLVPAERLARRLATVNVGISQNTAQSVGVVDTVIPCGVDRSAFRPGEKSPTPSILFVGTVGGRKRGRLLLETFERSILPRIPDCELWMVSGDRAEGRNVRWFGRVGDEQLRHLFASAWVFCLPSSYEGFGVPYIEAMASGTAVVATRNRGADEVITAESGGVVVHDDELGDAVASLLLDSSRRRALEGRGPAYSERYDWATVAKAYEDMYELARERVSPRSSAPDVTMGCGPW